MGLSDVMVFTVRIKIVNSFPTNYPCNEAVRYKGNRFVVVLDKLLTSTIIIRQICRRFVVQPWLELSHCNYEGRGEGNHLYLGRGGV